MKRLYCIIALTTLLALPSFSQTDKGWRSVGGSGMLQLDFKNSNYNFGLAPEMYWFVADKFALGFDFGFGFGTIKINDSTSSSYINAYVAPGIRYYFRDTEKKWRPYAFLNGGYESYADHFKMNNVKTNTTSTGFRGYAGMGLAWFFNEHAAFDMRLHVIDYTRNQAAFNPTFTIGIQAFFHHE